MSCRGADPCVSPDLHQETIFGAAVRLIEFVQRREMIGLRTRYASAVCEYIEPEQERSRV